MGNHLSRRKLLGIDFLFRERRRREREGQAIIRPPGAVRPEERFLDLCTRCHSCSRACPHDAVFHLGSEHGAAEGTPVMRLEQTPCRWCRTMDCIAACPSGALCREDQGDHACEPTAAWRGVRPIARATIDTSACLAYQGTLCDVCAVVCPSHLGAVRLRSRFPVIDGNACTGCGLCAHHCESIPVAIRLEELPHGSEGNSLEGAP